MGTDEVHGATGAVSAIRMPQLNVNDEEVRFVGWQVADGERVEEGAVLCEVETSKSVGEVPAPMTGVLKQASREGETISIGQVFAYIGPSIAAIDAWLSGQGGRGMTGESAVAPAWGATAGAIELARRYGIDLAAVSAAGRVRRADVERHIAEHGLPATGGLPATMKQSSTSSEQGLPIVLQGRVEDQGHLSDAAWSVAEHLNRTQGQVVSASVAMDVAAGAMLYWLEDQRRAGRVGSPLAVLLHGAAAAIRACPKLASFRMGRRVFAYRSKDVAFAARSADGRLFTPVVREVEARSLDALGDDAAALSMATFRGGPPAEDLVGACLTVSLLNDHPVRYHVGLQNAYQSAILTAGSIREEVRIVEGAPRAVPVMTLVLTYDHGLMDGWEAAAALSAAKEAMEHLAG
jgi:pyruvate dehydrogenase E2 component (dihydrolipoamide acetyltransferase)